jgi:Domain of unknown function (DUF4037)
MGITKSNPNRIKDRKRFIPGLTLNEGFFHGAIKPIIDTHFPNLRYDAALTGHGSDALGFDTYISMDHSWGPRATIFLSQEDHRRIAEKLKDVLRRNLPISFKGFPTNWNFDLPDNGARPEFSPDRQINPNISLITVGGLVKDELGIDYPGTISVRDWLTFSEQELLHLTSGKVFHNTLHELDDMRAYFKYYPHDIWLFKMRSLWNSIAEEQAFVGRCHDVEDDLGERIIATRITNKLMKLCFYLEKTYYPYTKWFGTGFSKLNCADELTPVFKKVLSANSYKQREKALCAAYLKIVENHNGLKITEPISLEIVDYYQRGYKGFQTLNIVQALSHAISKAFWQELDIRVGQTSLGRVYEIEPLLDDSNYVRNSKILRKMILG